MRRRSMLPIQSESSEESLAEYEVNRRVPRRRSRSRSRIRRNEQRQPQQRQPQQRQPPRGRRMITIPFRDTEYDNRLYTLTIPAPELCHGPRPANREQVYCGTKQQLPRGYSRHGTVFECLKKGFGAGRCSIYSRDRAQEEE